MATYLRQNGIIFGTLLVYVAIWWDFIAGHLYFSEDFKHFHLLFEYAYQSMDRNSVLPTWIPLFQGGQSVLPKTSMEYSPFGIDFLPVYYFTKILGLDETYSLVTINAWRMLILNAFFAYGCRRLAQEILESVHSANLVFMIALFAGAFFLHHRPAVTLGAFFQPWVFLYIVRIFNGPSKQLLHNFAGLTLWSALSFFHYFNLLVPIVWFNIGFFVVALLIFGFGRSLWKNLKQLDKSFRTWAGSFLLIATLALSALPLVSNFAYFSENGKRSLHSGTVTKEFLEKKDTYSKGYFLYERFEWHKLLSIFYGYPNTLYEITHVKEGSGSILTHRFQYLGVLSGLLLIVGIFFSKNKLRLPILLTLFLYFWFYRVDNSPLFSLALNLKLPIVPHFLNVQTHTVSLLALLAGMGLDVILALRKPNFQGWGYPFLLLKKVALSFCVIAGVGFSCYLGWEMLQDRNFGTEHQDVMFGVAVFLMIVLAGFSFFNLPQKLSSRMRSFGTAIGNRLQQNEKPGITAGNTALWLKKLKNKKAPLINLLLTVIVLFAAYKIGIRLLTEISCGPKLNAKEGFQFSLIFISLGVILLFIHIFIKSSLFKNGHLFLLGFALFDLGTFNTVALFQHAKCRFLVPSSSLYSHADTYFQKREPVPLLDSFSQLAPHDPSAYLVYNHPARYYPVFNKFGGVRTKFYYDLMYYGTPAVQNKVFGFNLPRLYLAENGLEDPSEEITRRVFQSKNGANLIDRVVFLNDPITRGQETLISEQDLQNVQSKPKFQVLEQFKLYPVKPNMVSSNIPIFQGAIHDIFSDTSPSLLKVNQILAKGDPPWWIQIDFGENNSKIINFVRTADKNPFRVQVVFLEGSHDGIHWKRAGYLTMGEMEQTASGQTQWHLLNQESFRHYKIVIHATSANVHGNHLPPKIQLGYEGRKLISEMEMKTNQIIPFSSFENKGPTLDNKFNIFSYMLPKYQLTGFSSAPNQRFGIQFDLRWDGNTKEINLSPTWKNEWHSKNLFQLNYKTKNNLLINIPHNKLQDYKGQNLHIKIKSPNTGARVMDFGPNKIKVATGSSKPGWLYYADSWDKFWTATIDGDQTPVYRANIQFKAVYLPRGNHIVEFKYQPTYFFWLILLGYLSQGAVLIFWFFTKPPLQNRATETYANG